MILVAGDAMTDRYLFGEVSRISPEAPVPVLRVERTEERRGAAANVAANVEAMGVPCKRLFSEGSGELLKIRAVGRSQQMLRIDFDPTQNPIADLGDTDKCTVAIFSDYGKGALSGVAALIAQAIERRICVLVDPKSYDWSRYRGAHVLKPNLDEARAAFGGWGSEGELERKMQQARTDHGIDAILLTRASAGMTLYDEWGAHHVPAQAREVYDVTGAGDTAIAALAVAIHDGLELLDAVRAANRAAGVAVGRFGTAVVSRKEVFPDGR